MLRSKVTGLSPLPILSIIAINFHYLGLSAFTVNSIPTWPEKFEMEHDTSKGGTHIDDLFVFADASTKAYGAIVYLSSAGHVSLAMSKTCVAPTRTITLPRLELMATRLTAFVCSSIPLDTQQVRVYFWTDSQIVLHWVHKDTNTKPFISHRVKEMKPF